MRKKGLSERSTVRYGSRLRPNARQKGNSITSRLLGLVLCSTILDVDMADADRYDGALDSGFNDDEWDDVPLPPGEEGVYMSHAGGETVLHQVMEGVWPGCGDPRTRSMHVQNQVDSWTEQIPLLVDAYLQYKNNGPIALDTRYSDWPLTVVGFDESGLQSFAHAFDALKVNETLIRHGYLGSSPDKPALAILLRTLEIYHQIHRICPRFTIDSLAKTLNYLHKVPRKTYLAKQLTNAYDAYLEIQHCVDQRVKVSLGRDETWDAKGVCPPCFYRVQNEPHLKYSFLGALDGGNSLKLVDSTFRAGNPRFDNRKLTSFRWLTPMEVDRYKDEVKNSPKMSMATPTLLAAVAASLAAGSSTASSAAQSSATPDSNTPSTAVISDTAPFTSSSANADLANGVDGTVDDDVAWLNVNELTSEESDELARCLNTCVERWKAAGPEARKKMFALFAVAGIFISVCRHGHVLLICDMIRSGELMKYLLAIVARLFELYSSDIAPGYDIMCVFYKTLLRSSLGHDTVKLRLRGVVPAFHGHAHNWGCQLGWHPMYIEGVGLEDFEECERTFSLSNHLASCMRLATPFHRQQQIDEHFHFHNKIRNFIFQNYHQAVKKITLNTIKLQALEEQLHTTAADYVQDIKDEASHLECFALNLPTLQRQWITWCSWLSTIPPTSRAAERDFKNLDYLITVKGYTAPQIQLVRTRYRTTHTRLVLIDEELTRFEEENGYVERSTSGHQEYQDAVLMMVQRHYWRTLDELERLVVQRLMELTKLSMSGVTYKLRDKIGKALKTRANAIHRAVNTYNIAAAALHPPQEQLSFVQVLKTVSLAEFDLLRDTCNDICNLPWTNPARREAATLYFGILRAREEIQCLNVEITRLLTFMLDEHVDYYIAIQNNYLQDPNLARELSDRWAYQVGRDPTLNLHYPLPPWATHTLRLQQVVVEIEEDDADVETPRELEGVDGDILGEIREFIATGLAKIVGRQLDMEYVHYEECIVLRYSMELVGWTANKFANPSELSSSLSILTTLRDALKNGECQWVKLSWEERRACQAKWDTGVADGTIIPKTRNPHSDVGKPHKRKHNKNVPIVTSPPASQAATAPLTKQCKTTTHAVDQAPKKPHAKLNKENKMAKKTAVGSKKSVTGGMRDDETTRKTTNDEPALPVPTGTVPNILAVSAISPASALPPASNPMMTIDPVLLA
ncbi:hypothetical protein MVEN_00077700 [Mycena venus]|uniref:CxC2-like cysteine cluster KDZ transposase-associated domain-containing protein n=1 Tax=Mycena venus TaxID=2733690 RepID=A0A8H6ZAJ7_9AGAR|nr:hypothetical protein MVEN_00077700 [Mycena venus]